MAIDNDERDRRDRRKLLSGSDAEVRWDPVKLNPEYSYEVDQGGSYTTLESDKIRKHFLYLGWNIDSRRDTILRYQYRSPDGKIYYSLKQVYHAFICGSHCQKQKHLQIVCTEPTKLDRNGEVGVGRNGEDLGLTEPECLSDSIQEYVDFVESKMKSNKKGFVDDLRLKAKKHLLFVGWTWCMKCLNTERPRLFYKSLAGKFFGSLVTACKAHLKDQLNDTDSLVPVRVRSPSSLTEEFGKPVIKSLKRKQNVSVSPDESPLATQESDHTKSKRIKRINSPIDRTKEREKVANSKGSRRNGSSTFTSPLTRTKTILSLLIDKDIVVPRTRVSYRHEIYGQNLKEGWVTCSGVHCTCCNKSFSVMDFETHARRKTERPLENIYLRDGRSLLDCLVQVMERDRPGAGLNTRFKADDSGLESDYLCSVCLGGGNVFLCNYCSSAYHPLCVGLMGEPEEDWSCPSCSCMYCRSSEYHTEANVFSDKTIIYCDQCEDEYHVGCNRNKKRRDISCRPTGSSFCGTSCSKIWKELDGIVGKNNHTAKEGYTWTILKYAQIEGGQSAKLERGTKADQNAKLCLAAEVLNECFMPIVESRTKSNLILDMVFNRESELKRLNFRGFYTIVLEKGDEVVSAATLRVHGEKFAEMALVGTRSQFRRQGLCRLLISSAEQLINYLGVKRLILPAAPQMLDMWIRSFGFKVMTKPELNDMLKYNILKFPGSPLCHKMYK